LSQSVLLVDDDPSILDSLGRFLERRGFEVLPESSGAAAIRTCQARRPEVVILDLRLPDAEGLSVLRSLREMNASVVLLTGHGDIETAVEAIRLGAEDFLTKPVALEHLAAVVSRIGDRARILRENERLRQSWMGHGGPEALGVSPGMTELARQVELVAASDRTVLLEGESGTGKGWLARVIHGLSPRADGPFVEANVAGITPAALAAELFGHEKGAFAETPERREGLILHADRGTLLLDEIGEVSLELQPRLARLIETRTLRRLGGEREIPVDTRLIATTRQSLLPAVEAGTFRDDFHYLLNVAPIVLPPLRERPIEDRQHLLDHLLGRLADELPGTPDAVSDEARALLLDYPWPGNIREMRNVLERALIFGRGESAIGPGHLPVEIRRPEVRRAVPRDGFQPESLAAVERNHIERMLQHHGGNRTHTARDLGIARTTLIEKIRRYEIEG